MLLGTVTRALVATIRDKALGPATLLEVRVDSAHLVAVDGVNAHVGQQVLVLTGYAAQHWMESSGKIGDAVVVAIVDKAAEPTR
jgi:microcompartment protein CcmK/EutM